MGTKQLDILKVQDKIAEENTYYNAPDIMPTFKRHEESIEVRTADDNTFIGKFEEVVLGILANFTYMPYWLLEQWGQDYNKNIFYLSQSWIRLGLVQIENGMLGIYLRPTRLLLEIYELDTTKYNPVNLGSLNHTVSEMQVMFDIQMGNTKSDFYNTLLSFNLNLLPAYHPLDIKPKNDTGTIAIKESEFRFMLNKGDVDLLNKQLIASIETGKNFTIEFTNFKHFPILGVKDGKQYIQNPDVIIPIPRENKKPNSISIEVELSAKPANSYVDIFNNYANNNRFGKLLYLFGSQTIYKRLMKAKEQVDLGSCELYLIPFVPPALKFDKFSAELQEKQGIVLNVQKSLTNKR